MTPREKAILVYVCVMILCAIVFGWSAATIEEARRRRLQRKWRRGEIAPDSRDSLTIFRNIHRRS